MGGGEHSDYDIEGIGNDFIADTMDMSLVDQVIKINDTEAFEGARKLALKEGIFAGSSSGQLWLQQKSLQPPVRKGISLLSCRMRRQVFQQASVWIIQTEKQLE